MKIFVFYDFLNTGNPASFSQNALLSRFNTTFRIDASYPSASSGTFQTQILNDVARNSTNTNTYVWVFLCIFLNSLFI